MINMGFIRDNFIGGAEKRAAKRQAEAATASGAVRSEAFTKAGARRAEGFREAGDILAPSALDAAQLRKGGLTSARDIFSSTLQRGREGLGGRTFDGEFEIETGPVSREVADPSALGDLSAFAEGGQISFQQQLAQSGALGPAAQAKFFRDFNVSPSTKFQLEQARRFVESGGETGGNRLRRLQEVGLGLIQQNLDQRFQDLGSLTQTGLTAASQKLTGQTNIEQLRNQIAIAAAEQGIQIDSTEIDAQLKQLGIQTQAETATEGLTARSFETEAAGLGDIEAAIGEALALGKTEEANALALAATGGSQAEADAILGAAGATATGIEGEAAATASGLLGKAGAVRGTVSDVAKGVGFVASGGLSGLTPPPATTPVTTPVGVI